MNNICGGNMIASQMNTNRPLRIAIGDVTSIPNGKPTFLVITFVTKLVRLISYVRIIVYFIFRANTIKYNVSCPLLFFNNSDVLFRMF